MKAKMTHAARRELVDAIRSRYRAASGKAKRRILEEFIAASGYHEKSAIRVLNEAPIAKQSQTRRRPSLYDEAARTALIVLWEASDRVCSKRLKALLPILLKAMERNGHLNLNAEIRPKILAMSAATIDRLLRMPRSASRTRKPPRVTPEPRRRIKRRTFADWNDPPPGSMEMDLVAHCGPVNRGSYVHSLVVTDIASGWTEAAPIVVREGSVVVETLERIRIGLPFALRAVDVDYGSDFAGGLMDFWAYTNKVKIDFSRPGKPTDNAFVESFNGRFREECLITHWFESLEDAKEKIDGWVWDYNERRPHRSLKGLTPREFAERRSSNGSRTHLPTCPDLGGLSRAALINPWPVRFDGATPVIGENPRIFDT